MDLNFPMTSVVTEKENNRRNVRGWSTLRKEERVFDERVGNSRRSSVAVDRCNEYGEREGE